MLSVDEVWDLIDREVHVLPDRRDPLALAGGRRLGEEVRADADMPAFTRSAIDGFALPAGSGPGRYRVLAEFPPGVAAPDLPEPGTALKIFTGSALPETGVGLVMLEDGTLEDDIVVTRVPASADYVRVRGSHCRRSDLLLPPGSRITPGTLALLASVGITHPLVSSRPLAAHLTTGSELVEAGEVPGPGCIRDSNSPLVAGLLADAGADLGFQRRGTESVDEAVAMLEKAESDLLLISGGASVGDHDGTQEILRQLGYSVHCSRVKSRPGKPLIFATRGRRVAFGLPGNPLSHFVCFHLFVRRALGRLAGLPVKKLLPVGLEGEFPKPGVRETWCPATVRGGSGSLLATMLPWRDSSDLTGLSGANALLRIGTAEDSSKQDSANKLAQALLFGSLEL